MVVRLVLALMLLAPAYAHAETWIGNNEIIERFHARGAWDSVGTGLSCRQDLTSRVSLGAEVDMMRVEAAPDGDTRHGFSFGAAALLHVIVARLPDADMHTHDIFTFELEGGAATVARFGIGADLRSDRELTFGFRLGFYAADRDPHPSGARAIGGHLGFRYGRNGSEHSVTFVLGYEWGL